jgi:hypothetical protein
VTNKTAIGGSFHFLSYNQQHKQLGGGGGGVEDCGKVKAPNLHFLFILTVKKSSNQILQLQKKLQSCEEKLTAVTQSSH